MEKLYVILMIAATNAFYHTPSPSPYRWIPRIVVPNTNEELVKALCSTYDKYGYCTDYETKIIIITKIFDFTGSEGNVTEEGCYHLSTPECIKQGQKKLNVSNQCKGLEKVMVTYDKAGINPIKVGSNKYIVSKDGGLKGKGLEVCNNNNVFISGLSITDINPELIWGGDAITLNQVANVWIHGNYFSRIGRQMIVTGFGSCQNVTISNNEFDGRTPYSAYCDGYHYWLWLFLGSNDTITLYNNYVYHTSGRGPHVCGMNNATVLLHMIKNKFENVVHSGLVEAYENARILMEGNTFINVSYVVRKNEGHIYCPFTKTESVACSKYLGRHCYRNVVINSAGIDFNNSDYSVLSELSKYDTINTDGVDKFDSLFHSPIYNNFKGNYTCV